MDKNKEDAAKQGCEGDDDAEEEGDEGRGKTPVVDPIRGES